LGTNGTVWQEGDAVPERGPLFLANVVDGRVTLYGRRAGTGR